MIDYPGMRLVMVV